MKDKVILITGSSSGIGAATAIAFARLDAQLVLHGTHLERLQDVANQCTEISPSKLKPCYYLADLSSEEDIVKFVESIKFTKIDILVNNAGTYRDARQAVHLTDLLLPRMQHKGANIINISSNLTIRPGRGTCAYTCAKAALTAYTKSLAVDLAPDIRVNSISPGPVATLMPVRLGIEQDVFRKVVGQDCLVERVGEVNEIARAVVFLASSESGFITGTDLIIDGGGSLKPSEIILIIVWFKSFL